MKHSSILKWTQTNRHNNSSSSSSSKGVVREWIHPPDALQRGHIAYLVKFLGSTEVDQPKGIDVVKEGIRKLKFSSQLRKSEGAKTPKVELTISIDGVAVQEPKTKRILHQYPLHRISYCADDKAEKKFFSFIAKEADDDGHVCFVFVSDKLAEEITLTIGQAFDLAYRRFLETSGRDLEMRKQLMILQKKIQSLETENRDLKLRIVDLQMLKDRNDVEEYKLENEITDLCVVGEAGVMEENVPTSPQPIDSIPKPPLPSRSHIASSVPRPNATVNKVPLSPSEELFQEFGTTLPVVGTKLENLNLDDFEDFNPRATTNGTLTKPLSPPETNTNGEVVPLLQPPPTLIPPFPQTNVVTTPPFVTNGGNHSVGSVMAKDLFGAEPFVPVANETVSSPDGEDPFGMGDFGEVPTHLGAHELETAIGDLDKRLSEMRDGFSRGISFGNDDFSLESLDPLNHKQPQL